MYPWPEIGRVVHMEGTTFRYSPPTTPPNQLLRSGLFGGTVRLSISRDACFSVLPPDPESGDAPVVPQPEGYPFCPLVGLNVPVTPSLADVAKPHRPEIAWPTPRTCRIEQSKLPAADAAVLCAERFISRNGYTQEPLVSDEAQIASESIEWSRSVREMLASRRGTLEPQAYGICDHGHWQDSGYTVVFRYAGGEAPDRSRAVTMTPEFGDLRVEHPDFIADVVTRRAHGCRPLNTRRR